MIQKKDHQTGWTALVAELINQYERMTIIKQLLQVSGLPLPENEGLYTFFEYFHGDSGKGLGASHQTGWTALVAELINQYGTNDNY